MEERAPGGKECSKGRGAARVYATAAWRPSSLLHLPLSSCLLLYLQARAHLARCPSNPEFLVPIP